jgi:hypothetical protein
MTRKDIVEIGNNFPLPEPRKQIQPITIQQIVETYGEENILYTDGDSREIMSSIPGH